MSFGTLVVAYFATGTAGKAFYFPYFVLGLEGVHAKLGHGVAPDADDFFLVGRSDVHHARVVGIDFLGLLYDGSRLVKIDFATEIMDFLL